MHELPTSQIFTLSNVPVCSGRAFLWVYIACLLLFFGCKEKEKNKDPFVEEMVFIPGGTFQMGCDEERDGECAPNEKPLHSVTISEFYMSRYEVTVGQFAQFVQETRFLTDAEQKGGGYIWNGSEWTKKEGVNWRDDPFGVPRPLQDYNHPVVHVSWDDCMAFTRWLSAKTGRRYRLPTEAEWEYAARAGENYRYAGSNDADEVLWSDENSNGSTQPVGQKAPNAFGLYDMSGSVWEWCSDWAADDYYAQSPPNNPQGPEEGANRIMRGGSWRYGARLCRVANRYNGTPTYRNGNRGFRIAR